MNGKEAQALLAGVRSEGFDAFIWTDGPHAEYHDHRHSGVTTHIILGGEFTLTMNGASETYREGQRFEIAAGAVHSSRMGPKGCEYIVGEK